RRTNNSRAVSGSWTPGEGKVGTVPPWRLSAGGRSKRRFWLGPGACPTPSHALTHCRDKIFQWVGRPFAADPPKPAANGLRSGGFGEESPLAGRVAVALG